MTPRVSASRKRRITCTANKRLRRPADMQPTFVAAKLARKKAAKKSIAEKNAKKVEVKRARKAARKSLDKEQAQAGAKPNKAIKMRNRLLARAVKLEVRAKRLLKESEELRAKHARMVAEAEVHLSSAILECRLPY